MELMEQVERYAKLENERADLKASLARIESDLKELKEPVLSYFQAHGIQNTKVHGRTLYVKRELWAGRAEGVTSAEAISALRAAGLDEYFGERIETQSLSAYLRELDREEQEMPLPLQGVIVANEVFKVGSRKA